MIKPSRIEEEAGVGAKKGLMLRCATSNEHFTAEYVDSAATGE